MATGSSTKWFTETVTYLYPISSMATDMCRGCGGHEYMLRSSSGMRSTSWKTKHWNAYCFSASTNAMFIMRALLNVCSPY